MTLIYIDVNFNSIKQDFYNFFSGIDLPDFGKPLIIRPKEELDKE
jgi:hypothetical protein